VVEQVKSMSSMGGFSKLKGMIPGFSKIQNKVPEGMLEGQEAKISKWEHILKSMTKQERENPKVFEDKKSGISRINRVSKGAGVNNTDVRSLLKQYKMLNEMMNLGGGMDFSQGMSQKQMQKLAKKFGKTKKIRF